MKQELENYYYYKQIQEIERNRIANELHDTSLQNLTHLTHKIELAGLYLDKDIIKTKLELAEINKELKNIINDIRGTIFDLRPMTFDDLGLKETIERYCENISIQSDLNVVYDIDEIKLEDNDRMLDIYRIIQECISNVIKHAKAKKLTIDLKNESCKIIILISDDGIGYNYESNVEKNHFGLKIVKERIQFLNGDYTVSSIQNKGTTVKIEIPKNK